ncbi:MAG: nucleoside hydrolase [Thermoguttaceae bacterium]
MRAMSTAFAILVCWASCGSAAETARTVPDLPAAGQRIRLVVDSDAACEIDDLYAIALAVTAQDRLVIEGFVAAHFGDTGGPQGIEKSFEQIKTVLQKAGVGDRFPVKRGAPPFQYSAVAPEAEGVDFLIERAMAGDPADPLWIVSLGACTDVAAAYLKRPQIADRVRVLWHGRTHWPVQCWNFNVYNDLKAARILFRSRLPLVLFDTGTYLRSPMEESERELKPSGPLGTYLHQFRFKQPWYQAADKGFFDLGDIAILLDPTLGYSEVVDAPNVEWDMRYLPTSANGRMRRVYQIDRDRTFELFHRRLADWAKTR